MKPLTFVAAIAVAAALSACGRDADQGPSAPPTASSTPSGTDAPLAAGPATTAPAPAAGSDTTAAAPNTAVMGAGADAGQATYTKSCAMCHAAGVAGAPKPGDKADWGTRVAQGKDVLYQHALQGFTGKQGVMPPKGGNTALPDAEVKAAVDYMVAQSK